MENNIALIQPEHFGSTVRLVRGQKVLLDNDLALKQAHGPADLHVYATGGHGFGLRRTPATVTAWPDRATEWLESSGWLKPR
ncbi:MAG: hypothetical protein WAO02_07290 [Verrucomicrobiia bacterium]